MENKIPTKQQAQKWANALRSGKYKQSAMTLQNTFGYCCLGVACDLFIPKEQQSKDGGILTGDYPKDQPCAPEWLVLVNDDVYSKLGYNLSTINDGYAYDQVSFDEIADIIELLYVHKAL